jgi:hypothetical protein
VTTHRGVHAHVWRVATAPGTAWKSSTDFRTSQRVGAVWWHRKVHIWDGFETNFEFRITSPTQCGAGDGICDGADGFAFVISNDDRQENVTSPWSNTGWACDQADGSNTGESYTLCGYGPDHTNIGHGFVGCPGDGLGYGESTQVDSADFGGVAANCRSGLKKSLAVEFDTFYNVERRDPKQGKQHWWINATEYVSYNDNHLGVFMSTAPYYANQPWPLSSSGHCHGTQGGSQRRQGGRALWLDPFRAHHGGWLDAHGED